MSWNGGGGLSLKGTAARPELTPPTAWPQLWEAAVENERFWVWEKQKQLLGERTGAGGR